ncbi:MAG: hypothetical protein SFV55_08190 [Haliscomenobacter sp.]|nr:hypothetical protein [Haliscomenobacter sp.]MDX2068392.1 hypothetical protein [Haliscomenobacter sp.]
MTMQFNFTFVLVCLVSSLSAQTTSNTPTDTLKKLELQTVEITGRLKKDYNSDYSFSATKIAILNKDLPQSIGTVTKELIADRQAFQLADAVKISSVDWVAESN